MTFRPKNSLFYYTNLVCFKEGTKILTNKGYISIEDLQQGDLIETLLYGYKPIAMISKRVMNNNPSENRIKEQLYKCSPKEYSELFEDLIIPGCHSILINNYTSSEQRRKTSEIIGKIFFIHNKYRLPVCLDDRASIYEKEGTYIIYNLALENDDYYMNYGIYANGLLVEACSQHYLKELYEMELIEYNI